MFPFFSVCPPLPLLRWHSCRVQSNDACLSETWWIVMNQACVPIWEKAKGRQRGYGKGLWIEAGGGGGGGGSAVSENRASLAALMQHKQHRAKKWLTTDAVALILFLFHTSHQRPMWQNPLKSEPNCIFSLGGVLVTHSTVAYSPHYNPPTPMPQIVRRRRVDIRGGDGWLERESEWGSERDGNTCCPQLRFTRQNSFSVCRSKKL